MVLEDYEGYNKSREFFDECVLHALRKGPQTEQQLNEAVGDAGIRRAACSSLRSAGKIYDSWDLTQPYERPFRYFLK